MPIDRDVNRGLVELPAPFDVGGVRSRGQQPRQTFENTHEIARLNHRRGQPEHVSEAAHEAVQLFRTVDDDADCLLEVVAAWRGQFT